MTDSDVFVEPLRRSDLARLRPLVWSMVDLNPIAYNAVGAFSLVVPMTDTVWDLVSFDEDGGYLPNPFLVSWRGVYQVPVVAEQYTPAKTIDDTSGIVTRTITFAGADMLSILANRIPYPDPTKTWAEQTAGTTTITGPAETVIKQLVQANVVDAGETARRFPNFAVAPDLGRGGEVTYTIVIKDASTTDDVAATSEQDLMEMVRTVASQSPIGVRIDLVDGQFVLDCYIPRDLSDRVVFSEQLGNLRAYTLTDEAPAGNAVLMQTGAGMVAASGPGADDPWRRVETYSDQTSTTDAGQITQAQTDALAQGAAVAKTTATVIDLPKLRLVRTTRTTRSRATASTPSLSTSVTGSSTPT